VRLGFGSITCQRHPREARAVTDLYQETLALAEEAERLGYDSIWASEHHFIDDSYLPSLLPLCAALAARTARIAVGTDVLLAPLHEPVRVAEDAAVVDLISGGRLLLGLALGWRDEEFAGLRVPLRQRRGRLEDTVATLRQAWSDGLVTGGATVSYPGVPVTPKPARPGGPPIWIGGTAEPAVRRAGRIADGFMASWTSLDAFTEQVAWVRDELEAAGRGDEGFTFRVVLPTFAWPEGDAWERIRDPFHYFVWKYTDMERARGRTGPAPLPPALGPGEEAALRGMMLLGTPDEVAEGILRYREIAGDGLHFIAEFCWPGLDPGLRREAMAVFAEEVAPNAR
jgi:alkanesulfonate monooxygenase SsuD/methylene tetrahydromethanopterin reductase-like flavin-dependent oxidoreductase (luciferase family)